MNCSHLSKNKTTHSEFYQSIGQIQITILTTFILKNNALAKTSIKSTFLYHSKNNHIFTVTGHKLILQIAYENSVTAQLYTVTCREYGSPGPISLKLFDWMLLVTSDFFIPCPSPNRNSVDTRVPPPMHDSKNRLHWDDS